MSHHGRLPISEAPRSSGAARVLLVDDDPSVALLIGEMLRAEWTQGLVIAHAQDVVDAASELAAHGATCALLSVTGSSRDVLLAAFERLHGVAPDVPIVVIGDDAAGEHGVELVRAGAQDVLRRSELNSQLLSRAMRYAIERNRSEVELAHQALHDPLTTLPNRALFVDRMTVALDRSRRTGTPVAVMFLDVDNFKRINDSMGHAAGDQLLTVLADRFRDMLRPMDTVSRFGGDEFTFLFEELESEREALLIAERITHSSSRSLTLADAPASVTVSIGIAFVTDPAVDPDSVIRDADAAMYRAKELGGARSELHGDSRPNRPDPSDVPPSRPDPSDVPPSRPERTEPEHAPSRSARPNPGEEPPPSIPIRHGRDGDPPRSVSAGDGELEDELRAALADSQLRLHYQPSVSLNGDTGLAGFEALVRWEHPERGLIDAEEFVRVAEDTGLIVPIGEWVLDQALQDIERWRHERPDVSVSVNLSSRQLEHPELVEKLTAAVRSSGADPALLCLEVTEDTVEHDPDLAARRLDAVSRLGVKVAIDDFGTGRSSLSSLRDLPLDAIKIDRSLVSELGNDPDAAAIVGALIELGHALGLTVVAEGVETDWQLARLRDLGCDGAQGYLFSKPLPEARVKALLAPA